MVTHLWFVRFDNTKMKWELKMIVKDEMAQRQRKISQRKQNSYTCLWVCGSDVFLSMSDNHNITIDFRLLKRRRTAGINFTKKYVSHHSILVTIIINLTTSPSYQNLLWILDLHKTWAATLILTDRDNNYTLDLLLSITHSFVIDVIIKI